MFRPGDLVVVVDTISSIRGLTAVVLNSGLDHDWSGGGWVRLNISGGRYAFSCVRLAKTELLKRYFNV